MSRADLAAALQITPGALSHWITGRRACPVNVLTRIAKILKIDKSWLLGETQAPVSTRAAERPQLRRLPNREAKMAETTATVEWGFRDAPQDGGRDFGNSNAYATPPDIETLVRESGQNSYDAQILGAKVHLRYTVIELTRGTEAFMRFMQALRFDRLKLHVERAAETKSKLGTRLRAGLERLLKEPKLLLLRIDDYGTTGLHGEERNDTRPFAALVRDNLNSAKESSTAGGSYGLGKAVLWRCSDISTVLLASHIDVGGTLRSRFIGKAELTWHELNGRAYAGPGWLGEPTTNSVWDADELTQALCLRRDAMPPAIDARRPMGTSALIVGFRDPKAETAADAGSLVEKIARAAAVNFWPAMIWDRLSVSVERIIDDRSEQHIVVDARKYVPAFCEALERHEDALIAERLAEPGDVIRVPVTITVPGTLPEAEELLPHPDLQTETLLLVRLAEGDEDTGSQETNTNTVALVRGRGMVTRYWLQTGIVVGARPFHAVLLAGEAVGTDAHHLAVEQFLRLSEPPAHNRWEFNDELREKYQRGSKARLDEFHRGITEALRDAVKPVASGEDDGPDELKRLLQLEGPPPPESPPATLRQVEARLVEGAWHVAAEIHVNDRTKEWAITPRLSLDVESGSPIRVRWGALEATGAGVRTDGETVIVASKSRRFSFRGVSDPTSHRVAASRCRAKLDIVCHRVPAPDRGE
jgi:hypothetical protein